MREILSGELGDISLSSLLQLLDGESVTGWLAVAPSARVGLCRGAPVHAELGPFTGVSALLDLFAAESGRFTVSEDPTVEGRPLGDVLGLVLEGCRIADEWSRLGGLLVLPADADDADRDDAVGRVLGHLDGNRTLGEAVALAGEPRSEVVDGLLERVERGTLRELTSPLAPERTRAPLPSDYFSALDAGRQHLRAGAYDAAASAFEHALVLRPGDRVAAQNLRRLEELRGDRDRWQAAGRGR